MTSIDKNNPLPIYLQIVRQIKEQILVGELAAGDELPSVRELGDALGISLLTARSAYQTLSDAGLLRIRLGKRARIVAAPEAEAAARGSGPGDVVVNALTDRIREVVVDGLLRGMSEHSIRKMLDGQVKRLVARRTEAARAMEKGE